jgi:multiple sugar transport system permease protein
LTTRPDGFVSAVPVLVPQPAATDGVRAVPRRPRLPEAEHRRLRRRIRLRRELIGWGFLAPMFIFFVAFLVVPVLGTFFWSTQDGGLTTGSEFVGLDNFAQLPSMVSAVTAIQNTLIFAALSIPPTLILALGVAMLLARVQRGAAAYRFLVYFPVLVPGVVAGLIWIFLTSVDFGMFNTILKALGAKPVTWLGAGSALPVLAALDVWRSLGYWAIFFLAALIGLPQELYQAAELDGARPWQRFRFLTVPLLRRILLFAIVVSTIFGLQVFDTALVLTEGGPGTATTTIVYRVWRYVFGESDKVGIGAAISLVLLVAILTLTLVQMRVLRGRGGES